MVEALIPAEPSVERVRSALYLLAGLMAIGAGFLLMHRSLYPYVLWYSRLYLYGLACYLAVLLAVLALACFGAPAVARVLRVRWVASFALAAGGFTLAMLVLEALLALVPVRLWNLDPGALEGPIFARQEPPLHHVRPANSRHVIVSPHGEFRTDVRINSDNLRDVERPVAKPPGVFRVLLLGDSMVEAVQVALEDTFAKRLERLLTDRAGRPVDVINAAVASYSPTAEYLMLKHKGLKYQPDVVVLAFFMADVADDWQYRADFVFDAAGVPVERRQRVDSTLLNALLSRSRLLTFTFGNLTLLRADPLAGLAYTIFRSEYTECEQQAWRVTMTALDATRGLAQAHGAGFLLMAIPYPAQVRPEEGRAGGARLKYPDYVRTSTKPQQILAEFSRERRIPYLDLLLPLRDAQGHPLFFDYDQHFTPKGHNVVAATLASFLLERELVPAGTGRERR